MTAAGKGARQGSVMTSAGMAANQIGSVMSQINEAYAIDENF